MRHSNTTATRPIDNRLLLDKDISFLNMATSISKKISVKDSTSKPLPRDISFGVDPDIRFYDIEDGDKTEKGEEAEILVFYDSSILVSKQNLVKR